MQKPDTTDKECMLLKLFLLFTIIPMLELAFLIEIGSVIGTMNTIMLILLTGVSGAALAKSQGISVLSKIQMEMQAGRLPAEELLNGAFVLAGGVLLLTPGFITDLSGLVLLLPLTRNIIKRWLRRKLEEKMASGDITIGWR